MLKSFFPLLILLVTNGLAAQEISNQVVNSTGGSEQLLNGYSLEFAIGEPVIVTFSEPTMVLTQGFLQAENRLSIPVELLSFNAQLLDKHVVRLNWATSSELNAAYFAVEKSLNGTDFKQIGQVKAAGYSSKTNNYFYDDALTTSETIIYYRLKQIDVGGTSKYTKIVAIYLPTKNENTVLKVYPNPARHTITVEHSKGVKSVSIYTIEGRLIKKTTETDIRISDCAAGLYVLEVENTEGGTSRIKFVKLL